MLLYHHMVINFSFKLKLSVQVNCFMFNANKRSINANEAIPLYKCYMEYMNRG